MKTKRTFIMALVAVCLIGGVAVGHDQRKDDPNDSPDRLDLKSVKVSHTARRMILDIKTWESWPTAELQSGKRTIYFTFDTKGGKAADYNINILRSDNDGLVCLVGTEPDGARAGEGRASRNGDQHVRCNFSRRDIEAGGSKTIRWKGSMFNLETFERDYVPNSGMVRHQL
jgi:hypothetical protein